MECLPWYTDPACLVTQWTEFFPARGMTPAETLNAVVRFVVYSTLMISLYRNEYTPLVVGAAVILVVSAVYAPRMHVHVATTTHSHRKKETCTAPTPDNPFMNVLAHEYSKDKPAACAPSMAQDKRVNDLFEDGLIREVSDPYKKRASDRQFITMPVSSSIPDTRAFSNYLFSETVRGPKCK